MLLASWRIVLYPFLLVVGISILFGFVRRIQEGDSLVPALVAGSVVVLFFILFIWVDVLSGGEPPGSTNYVFGMTPAMAVYVIGVPILVALPSLLYALTFTREDLETASNEERGG
jgi:predicted acyltransferase